MFNKRKILPGRLISPPELIHRPDSELTKFYIYRGYDERKRLEHKPNSQGKRRQCPLCLYNHVYLCGDDAENHRWGVTLDEDDFYRQVKALGTSLPIIVGVRRTNFFKLDKIISLISKYRNIPSPKKISLRPLHSLKQRFSRYLKIMRSEYSRYNIKFRVVDMAVMPLLQGIGKNGLDERDVWKVLGPICKDVFSGPEYMLLNLNGTCNTDCIYCRKFSKLAPKTPPELSPSREKEFMDLELVESVLQNAKEMDVKTLLLVGEGEPTLHPEFGKVLNLINDSGIGFNISTNGMLLNKYADSLTTGSCLNLTISMSFASKETFGKIRPNTNQKYVEIIERNIRTIAGKKRKKTPKIILLHAINRHNYKDILKMVEKAKELGGNCMWFQLTHLSKFNEKELKLSESEMKETNRLLSEAKKLCHAKGIEFNSFIDYELEHYNHQKGEWSDQGMLENGCFVGWHFTYIDFRSLVSFCCGNSFIGDLQRNSLKDIWYSPTYRRYRNDGLIMHVENPIDMYGKPLYDDFCLSCDNHDQNAMIYNLIGKVYLSQLPESRFLDILFNHLEKQSKKKISPLHYSAINSLMSLIMRIKQKRIDAITERRV